MKANGKEQKMYNVGGQKVGNYVEIMKMNEPALTASASPSLHSLVVQYQS